MGRESEISVSHVNAHQRVASATEDFNDQVAQITLSVESHQALSLATPTIFQRAHEWSGYGDSEGDYAWGQQQEQPLSKAKSTVTGYSYCWGPNLPAAETNAEVMIQTQHGFHNGNILQAD